MSEKIQELREKIDILEKKLYELIQEENKELEDFENPYSRLIALQKMKIVKDYEKIKSKSVAVVGIGGVGSVASEMLVRCGIGRIVLFDFDDVNLVNMNRMFFLPSQIGLSKVDAAKNTLEKINPSVEIQTCSYDITKVRNYDDFLSRIAGVDLVLSCVDNFGARIAINRACLIKNVKWFESGVSETAVNGHIQFLVPGQSACYECAPPLVIVDEENEKKVTHEQECAASLPTTMAIIAGLMVQNVLKYLLDFGEVSWFLGYNSMMDFFPKMMLKANNECSNEDCRKLQVIYKKEVMESKKIVVQQQKEEEEEEEEVIHEENKWGIEVVGKSEEEEVKKEVVKGIRFQYIPQKKEGEGEKKKKEVGCDDDVDDLFSQFEKLQE